MELSLYIGKGIFAWFIAMNVIAIAVNMADRKENRMPWKRLFISTWRMSAAIFVAGLIIAGLIVLLFKR